MICQGKLTATFNKSFQSELHKMQKDIKETQNNTKN